MGRSKKLRQEKLAGKLKQIRDGTGLSQPELAARLSNDRYTVRSGHISDFELGKSEPNLQTLLLYAMLAGIHLEVLVDDALDLPKRLTRRADRRA
jgi:transcriptional regulator with XRE-family HTH domain